MKDPKPNQVASPADAQTSPGKPIQRWSAARKRDVVLRLLRDESIEAVARRSGSSPAAWSSGASAPWPPWSLR